MPKEIKGGREVDVYAPKSRGAFNYKLSSFTQYKGYEEVIVISRIFRLSVAEKGQGKKYLLVELS